VLVLIIWFVFMNDENKNTLVSVTWGKKESYGFFFNFQSLKNKFENLEKQKSNNDGNYCSS